MIGLPPPLWLYKIYILSEAHSAVKCFTSWMASLYVSHWSSTQALVSFSQDWKISWDEEEVYPPFNWLVLGSHIWNSWAAAWSRFTSRFLETGLSGSTATPWNLHGIDSPRSCPQIFTCKGWSFGEKVSSSASMSSNDPQFALEITDGGSETTFSYLPCTDYPQYYIEYLIP